jgi:hypothetical protein
VRLCAFALVLALTGSALACGPVNTGPMHTSLVDVATKGADALAVSDALEELIAAGKDSPADREFALDYIRKHPQEGAAYAFARAAVTGRVVQTRGLGGAMLVSEVEHWAEKSRKLDPEFRKGAAARMLGTLYVMAPSGWLEHGNSEAGIELLEELVKNHPEVLENHLRLAEAYISLGDPGSATTYLCRCLARKNELRRDEQGLLDHLFADANNPKCPGVPTPAPAPAPKK